LAAQTPAAPGVQTRGGGGLGTESGFGIFQQRCMKCHADASTKAPDPTALRQLSPETIYQTLSAGAAHVPGAPLSEEEERRVSESVSGRLLGTATDGEATRMPNRCANGSRMPDPATAPAWNGWGADIANTRFQRREAAGLAADDVPRLKLKWAFGFPKGVSAF